MLASYRCVDIKIYNNNNKNNSDFETKFMRDLNGCTDLLLLTVFNPEMKLAG